MKFSELEGKTITAITGTEVGSEGVTITADGKDYRLYHSQDCCESVSIAEVHGEPNDLIGKKVALAVESSNNDYKPSKYAYSWTWTFYRIQSEAGGSLVLRWLGESNGYYSESVSFEEA